MWCMFSLFFPLYSLVFGKETLLGQRMQVAASSLEQLYEHTSVDLLLTMTFLSTP
jgi:hypothetical protein